MIKGTSKIRVRYGETDRMQYLHHGNYALYYEEARSNLLREFGISYREIEDAGVIMPVIEMNSKFFVPAIYDEILTIHTYIKEEPKVKFRFDYEIFNQKEELVNRGYTILVFVDNKSRKPIRTPIFFQNFFNKTKV